MPNGTCLQEFVNCSYEQLEKLFGLPNSNGDDYKVSTEWIFEDSNGNIVTLYDYKETYLYNRNYPSVDEFRKKESYQWHIGAKSGEAAKQFINYLERLLKMV